MLYKVFAASAATTLAGILLVCFSPYAFAASGPDVQSKQSRVEVSKFVDERLHTWQERMNLKDWDIRVKIVRADHLEPKTLGNISWDTDVKKATIDVLSPVDYPLPYDAMLADMEVTVVHELVHLELASLPRSAESRRVEERAVNEIAAALLRMSRQ